jgi:hypothetical protein
MRIVPGRRMTSTLTPNGHLPDYTANGTACYAITILTLLVSAHLGVLDPASIYDMYGNILASLNVFAWLFCDALYVKGHLAPSTTGPVLQDFVWGMELYPAFIGWDVKSFYQLSIGHDVLGCGGHILRLQEYATATGRTAAVPHGRVCGATIDLYFQILSLGNGIYAQYGYST